MVCHAIVLLSSGTGQCDRGSAGRPSRKGFGSGRGSVIRASTLGPNRGLLKIPRGELIWGLATHPMEVVVDQLGDPKRI